MLHDNKRWTANRRYHTVILNTVPRNCRHVLDVGCGLGELTRQLRTLVPEVTGIDADMCSVELARSHSDAGDITYIHDDFLVANMPAASFDMIAAVASIHHMDARAALERMRHLLRPGGVLAVIGLARDSSVLDTVLSVPAAVGKFVHQLADTKSGAAIPAYHSPLRWPPPENFESMRRLAEQLLPGARYRRHLYWRYSLIWSKPACAIVRPAAVRPEVAPNDLGSSNLQRLTRRALRTSEPV